MKRDWLALALRGWAWSLPLLWGAVSIGSFYFRGDEYAFWVVSSLPGYPGFLLIPNDSGKWSFLTALTVALAGALCLLPVAALVWWLRVRLRTWAALQFVLWSGLVAWSLAQFPSLDRAIAKNGPLFGYFLVGFNVAFYLSVLGCITIAGAVKVWHRKRMDVERI